MPSPIIRNEDGEEVCAKTHSAFIMDRGGKRRIGELTNLNLVRWERVRDDISSSLVQLSASSCSAQAELLEKIEPKRHEMCIYRGDERVWEGPINRAAWRPWGMELAAQDVAAYLFGRPLSKAWSSAYPATEPVTQRMMRIIEHELNQPFSYLASDGETHVQVPAWEQLDPPANVWPHVVRHAFPNEAETSAATEPFQMSVGEHLDNFARYGGIDYTAIGRSIHLWDTSRSFTQTRTVTSADFGGEVTVTAYGADFAALAFTVAQDGRYGGAGQNSDYYGPWAKIFTVYDEDETHPPSQADLNSQASRNLSGRNPVPVEVRVPDNSTVKLGSGLEIWHLVPGAHVPLLATLNSRKVSQMQKIQRVTVAEDGNGESIKLTLTPATREDSNEEVQ